MKDVTELPQWHALQEHQKTILPQKMRDLFARDPARFSQFSLQEEGLLFDFSRNRITRETLSLLASLAQAAGLPKNIEALFTGQAINTTEKRPALHTALRDKGRTAIWVKGKNIAPLIQETQAQMRHIVSKIHDRTWLGATGKPIAHIINVGIGGSHLGPRMCTEALSDYAQGGLSFHFISSVDKAGLNEVLHQIDPEAALFIISSKTFTTIETMTNAKTILAWMQAKLGNACMKQHFIGITAALGLAIEFGIPQENVLPMWEWVGGRYSVWSAIGLPLMLMLGHTQYDRFLEGAYLMDQHFRQSEFAKNMPVLLALLGIWYMNFFGARIQAIVPYAHRLRYIVPYLQQAEMESNGKSTRTNGQNANYATGPVVFGEEGCNGQHAYHQLLLQGQHLIPVDFILVATVDADQQGPHQDILLASGLAQAQALMRGKTYAEALNELQEANCPSDEAAALAHHRIVPGNSPCNVLLLEKLTPKTLGGLIALYEHKIFVQGTIWDINSFDQWGVELGKQMLPEILRSFKGQASSRVDPSTMALIHQFKRWSRPS